MKKILYVAISSQIGGVPKHIMNVLERNKEFQITVAAPDDGDYYERFEKYAAEVLDIKLKPYSFRGLLKLRNYVKKNKIDIVHSHGKGAGMYTRPLKILCPGIKVIHTFHGIYLERYGKLVRTIYIGIEHVLRFLTDVFVCVSESERQEALIHKFSFEGKTVVIPNGVDLEAFQRSSVDIKEYRHAIGIEEGEFVIGCVARLEAMKGHCYLIDAFANVVKHYPQSCLLLIGDGPDREEIEQKIVECGLEDRIRLLGFRHDIPELLQLMDLFVSCSLKEGMPYTLIEALAMGVPVVATDVIGNRDLIKDAQDGWLAESQNSEDIGKKIMLAMEHDDLRKQYSEAGKKKVADEFTVEKSVQQLLDIYRKIVE